MSDSLIQFPISLLYIKYLKSTSVELRWHKQGFAFKEFILIKELYSDNLNFSALHTMGTVRRQVSGQDQLCSGKKEEHVPGYRCVWNKPVPEVQVIQGY